VNIKGGVWRSAAALGVPGVLRLAKRGATILCYHGVERSIRDPRVQRLQTPLGLFEKQVGYLKRNFDLVSLDELRESIVRGRPKPGQVALTFDDGYRNNLTIAAPLLHALRIPFAVFVSTYYTGTDERLPGYYLRTALFRSPARRLEALGIHFELSGEESREAARVALWRVLKTAPRKQVETLVKEVVAQIPEGFWEDAGNMFRSEKLMSWEDLAALRGLGATIGSHCHHHAILHRNQAAGEAAFQLRRSKQVLEAAFGECRYFAYPNGTAPDVSPESQLELERNGYELALTTVPGEVESDARPLLLPRVAAHPDFDAFRVVVNAAFLNRRRYAQWTTTV